MKQVNCKVKRSVSWYCSLRKHTFVLALRRWGRPSDEERGETDVFAGYWYCENHCWFTFVISWGGGGGRGDGYCSVTPQCPFSLLYTSTGDCTCPQHQENTFRRQSEWVRNVHIDLKPTFFEHVTSPYTKKSLLFRCGYKLRVDHMWRHAKLIWGLAAYWSVISSVRRASPLPSPPSHVIHYSV